jgi:hypothetical protein
LPLDLENFDDLARAGVDDQDFIRDLTLNVCNGS